MHLGLGVHHIRLGPVLVRSWRSRPGAGRGGGTFDGSPPMGRASDGASDGAPPTAEARESRGRCISALEFTTSISALVPHVRPCLGEAGQVQEVVGASMETVEAVSAPVMSQSVKGASDGVPPTGDL